MAQRPLFIPTRDGDLLVKTVNIDFQWFPGLSVAQKQRSIRSLQSEAKSVEGVDQILEISTKSESDLGVALSGFNLMLASSECAEPISVESAFQGSKIRDDGGPYNDIYEMSSLDAKRDPRLQTPGHLKAFRFEGETWPLEPRTAFYDWLFLKALKQHSQYLRPLMQYSAFTDIEFNPAKAVSCQANSAALCVSLERRGLLDKVTKDQGTFLSFLGQHPINRVDQPD